MKKLIQISTFLAIITLSFTSLFAQEINIGDKISNLEVEQYLQAPQENYTFEELKGEALVFEFWATWCAPCIALIPHLNQLTNKFSNQPVRFISITDEKKSIVTHFLERHKIKGWIGLDTNESVFKKFNIHAIPQTILIYPSGKIAAITRANKVNGETIEKLIAGAPLDITEKKPQLKSKKKQEQTIKKEKPKPLLKIEIRPTDNKGGFTRKGISIGIFHTTSITLNEVLQVAYQFPPARITGPDSLLNKTLFVSVKAPNKKDKAFLKVLRYALATSLDLKINYKKKKMDLYILTAPNGVVKGLRVHKSRIGHTSTASGVIAASSQEISILGRQLEELLHIVVKNKTNLDKKYAWTVTYDSANPKSVIGAIEDQLGLELQKKQKTEKVLVVNQK